MAGEIEEPFRMNFQADSIHSGSISFGRFETEALCWERRSSFSHNRYLEEVEKCSKPGSVIEKKAYFEARLRKKGILGILGQSSPDSQNEKDYQTSENDVSDIHSEEIDHMSAGNRSARFDQRSETDASDNNSAEIDPLSAKNCPARFVEAPVGAVYEVEHEESQFEREVFGTSISEPQIEIACHNNDYIEYVPQNVEVEESNNVIVGDLPPSDYTLGIGLQENPDGEVRNLHQIGPCTDRVAEESTSTSPNELQGSSIKEKVPPAAECTKPRLTPRLAVANNRNYDSSREFKGSKSKPGQKEKVNEANLRTKTDAKISLAATQNKYQIRKTSKNEPASRTKGIDRTRSAGKESREVAVSDSQFSTLKKAPARMNQSAIRSKPTAGDPKPRMKQDGSRSVLKCSEPSQKRGQFGVSLEEKVHKNETKLPQLRAKTPGKKPEIKQLSKSLNLNKSLNFKAKPLPSFYNGALRESDRNKAPLSTVKPRKLRTDALNPVTRVATAPSSSQGRKGACDLPLASGALSCHSTVTSDSNPSSPVAKTGSNNLSLGEINRLVGVKKDHMEKSTSLSKHKVPEAKGRTMAVKPKTRTNNVTSK